MKKKIIKKVAKKATSVVSKRRKQLEREIASVLGSHGSLSEILAGLRKEAKKARGPKSRAVAGGGGDAVKKSGFWSEATPEMKSAEVLSKHQKTGMAGYKRKVGVRHSIAEANKRNYVEQGRISRARVEEIEKNRKRRKNK